MTDNIEPKARHIHKTLIENFDFCDRYAYLKNYWNPPHEGDTPLHGVTLPSTDPSRVVGAAVHAGVNAIAIGASVDGGVAAAIAGYDDEVKSYEVNDVHLLDQHRVLIDATVRIWARVQLPIIQAQFKIVEAETSIFVPLTPGLTAIARPDIVLQDLRDGRYVNYSLKTEKGHSYFKHPSALIDVGGTMEMAALAYKMGGLEKVSGTWMTYLVVGDTKGKVDEDEGLVIWHPGVRGWVAPSPAGLGPARYAWKWEYDNPSYDPHGPKDSRKNAKTKRLSAKDGWERAHSWEYPGGVAAWVDDMLAGKFQPFGVDAAKELVYSPEPYERGEGHLESFLVEVVTKQTQVNKSLAAVNAGEDIDVHFPKRRSSCLRYGRCEMWDICWRGAGRDPLSQGYVPRKSSIDKMKEKGLIVEA